MTDNLVAVLFAPQVANIHGDCGNIHVSVTHALGTEYARADTTTKPREWVG